MAAFLIDLGLIILVRLSYGIRAREKRSWLLPKSLDFKSYYFNNDYWVDDDDYEAENEYDDSAEVLLQSTYAALHSIPVPLSLHSDTAQSVVCGSSVYSSLIATPTYSMPLVTMAESGDFCITRPHSEHPQMWSGQCIWLVLGSYVCIITLGISVLGLRRQKYVTQAKTNGLVVSETKLHVKTPVPQTVDHFVYVPGAPLPASEDVIKRTFEQYGNIYELEELKDLSPSPALKVAVRKDIALLFRGPISPGSPLYNHDEPLDEVEASYPNSAPTAPPDRADTPKPVRAKVVITNPTQISVRSVPTPNYNTSVSKNTTPAVVQQGIPTVVPKPHRPPPIVITNTSGMKIQVPIYCTQTSGPIHPCFSSSPLKHSSIPISRAASMSPIPSRMVHSASPALSEPGIPTGLKASMWAH
ncbi:hypothetical protein BDV93DRAFT_551217 [Ceratobasidium sp. AG-I]|nr:hypothetical protein BDV93DRAFT_551217 [Ceratobasidium sp. AG-I]